MSREIDLSYETEGTLHSIKWTDEHSPPRELRRLSVFDSSAARLYVDAARRISFLPRDLHIVTELGRCVRDLENMLKEREKVAAKAVSAGLPTGYNEGTGASKLLARLKKEVGLSGLPTEEEIRSLAIWTPEDEDDLASLTRGLAVTPAQRAKELRSQAISLSTVANHCSEIEATLSDQVVAELQRLQADAAEKRRLASLEASELFSAEPVANVGSHSWHQMLRYARDFAFEVDSHAHADALSESNRCVLCQQDLTQDAHQRLARFEAYLDDRRTADAEAARQAFQAAAGKILNFRLPRDGDLEVLFSSACLGLGLVDQDLRSLFVAATERHSLLSESIRNKNYDSIQRLPPLALVLDLAPTVERLTSEAELLESSGEDQDRVRRQTAFNELADRRRLTSEVELLVGRRNDLQVFLNVSRCKGLCATGPITTFLGKLRKEVLTPTLVAKLEDELRSLDLSYLPVKLHDRGEAGDTRVGVDLLTSEKLKNSDILSEGEQRGLALACFLAELGEVGDRHGIIIDDPVSSLDHSRMERVADRLTREAATRQVIIFTHNIVFHHAIKSAAMIAGIPVWEEFVSSAGGSFGIIDKSREPWALQGVGSRLGQVDRALASLRRTYDCKDESFRRNVIAIYTMIRETWERLIEEVLFANVIERFRPEVQTLKIRMAHIDDEDRKAVNEGMTRASRFSGHDAPKAAPPDLPELADIDADVNELRDYFNVANVRRRNLEAGAKARKAPQIARVIEIA
jgi:hypothetical protein